MLSIQQTKIRREMRQALKGLATEKKVGVKETI